MKTLTTLLLAVTALLVSCSSSEGEDASKSWARGVYLLLDTSGTYTQELTKAQQLINYMLAMLEPGDTFAVARIDSGSFSEKDIVAKVVLDGRPSGRVLDSGPSGSWLSRLKYSSGANVRSQCVPRTSM